MVDDKKKKNNLKPKTSQLFLELGMCIKILTFHMLFHCFTMIFVNIYSFFLEIIPLGGYEGAKLFIALQSHLHFTLSLFPIVLQFQIC